MGFQPGGVKEFVKLTDTPSAFTGAGGKLVKVDAGATALEFGSVVPTPILDQLDQIWQHYYQKLLEDWIEVVVGAGSSIYSASLGYLQVSSGVIAGDMAQRTWQCLIGESGGANRFDWDSEMILQFIGSFDVSGAAVGDKIAGMHLKKGNTSNILADKGIGFGYERNGVHLICESHDGIGREPTDLGVSSYIENLFVGSSPAGTILRVHHRPAGANAVKFYILNAAGGFDLVATHTTRVPSGVSSGAMMVFARNNTTASNIAAILTDAQLYRPIPVA
ncbi:hypothetical protein ES703_69757 [subsurface metagenome]